MRSSIPLSGCVRRSETDASCIQCAAALADLCSKRTPRVASVPHASTVTSRAAASFRSYRSVSHCMLGDDLAAGQSSARKCFRKASERQA
ncbi:hypothetical protein EYF80_047444 [Liparis tanakae]|uniref:Uncharacterized protein n=1 Tax=Liparis tanakae TaxID=230148 RepID=A0A4Z2FMK2_9TELE|nr:hypothetical protein EYF80_047444 [Liparis tanakae]